MSISQDAQAVINNAGPGALDYINSQGGYGNVLTSGEARRLLTGFQATGDPYSSNNISQSTTAPAQKPDYSDPYRMRDTIYNELGIPELRQQATDLKNKLREYDTETTNLGFNLENKLFSMNKIRGLQDVELKQRALGRLSMADELQASADLLSANLGEAQTRYQIAMGERDKLQSLMLQAPGAKIKFSDSYEKAVKKLGKWQKKEAKKAYKKELQALARQYGISTKTKKGGTMKTKKLERAIAKYNKRALKEAKQRADQEWQMKVNEYNYKVSHRGSGSSGATVGEGIQEINGLIEREGARGQDGYISPSAYAEYKQLWLANGLKSKDFEDSFGYLKNPADYEF